MAKEDEEFFPPSNNCIRMQEWEEGPLKNGPDKKIKFMPDTSKNTKNTSKLNIRKENTYLPRWHKNWEFRKITANADHTTRR